MARQRAQTPRTATTQWKNVRRKVINKARREGLTNCPNCAVELIWSGPRQAASAEVDHIVPYSRGGTDHPDNLTVLCNRCNTRKGNKTHAHANTRTHANTRARGNGDAITTGWISRTWQPPANYKPPQTNNTPA